jgi:hypothetical protein
MLEQGMHEVISPVQQPPRLHDDQNYWQQQLLLVSLLLFVWNAVDL